MYVLDSSAIIELVNGTENADKITSVLGKELLVTTSICMHEVLAGAESKKDKFVLENIFNGMHILDHTPAAAHIGAKIYQDLIKIGKKVNGMDVLIAAICQTNNAALVTLDKDFERIKSIKTMIIS